MVGKPLRSHVISFPQITDTEGDQDEDADLGTAFVGMQMSFTFVDPTGRARCSQKFGPSAQARVDIALVLQRVSVRL